MDSVRWIRPDCIAVGCFELNDDGEEQNYIVQVITSKEGKITDVSNLIPCIQNYDHIINCNLFLSIYLKTFYATTDIQLLLHHFSILLEA